MLNFASYSKFFVFLALLVNAFTLYSQDLRLSASKSKVCIGDAVNLSLVYANCTSVTWQYSSNNGNTFSSFSSTLSTSNTYTIDKDYCFRAMGKVGGTTKYSNIVCVDAMPNYEPDWYYGDRRMLSGEQIDFCGEQTDFGFSVISSMLEKGQDPSYLKQNFQSKWTIDGRLFSNDFDIVVPLIDRDVTIVHTVSSDFCSDVSFKFNFNIVEIPTVELSTPTPVVCKGSDAKLDITYTGDVTKTLWYEGGKSTPINSAFSNTYSFTPKSSELYYVEAYTAEGCVVKSDYVNIEIEQPYVPSWSRGSEPFRSGDVLDFCGEVVDFGFNLFAGFRSESDKEDFKRLHTSEWFIDGVKVSDDYEYRMPLLTKSGIVTHRVIGRSCSALDFDFKFNIQPIPEVSISSTQTEVCEGSDLILDIDFDSNTKSMSVFQKTSAGQTKVADNLTKKLTLSPDKDAVYWVEAMNGDCKATSNEFRVAVLPELSVQVNAPQPEVCLGEEVTALATVTKGTPKSISWTKNRETLSSSVDMADSPQTDVTYKLEVSNGDCPSFSQTYPVKVVSVDFSVDDVSICEGETATIKATTSSGNKVSWYDDLSNKISDNAVLSVSPSKTTEYFLTVASGSGACKAEGSASVKVRPLPHVVDYSELGSSAYKLDIEGGTGKVLVDFGNGAEPSTSNILTDAESDRVYHVILTDELGCTSTFELETNTFELEIPKYFVANRESWVIKNVEKLKKCHLTIFDRYGKLIYVSDTPADGWDGTYNGNDMPSTDYWFVLDIESRDMQYSGHFSLLRE